MEITRIKYRMHNIKKKEGRNKKKGRKYTKRNVGGISYTGYDFLQERRITLVQSCKGKIEFRLAFSLHILYMDTNLVNGK